MGGPSHTPFPSASPTQDNLMAQLRYPSEVSDMITGIFITFVVIVIVLWALAIAFFYARKNGYVQLPSDKEHMLSLSKTKSQKRRIKKFEDYWDEESDDSITNFPNRAPIGNTFDDLWDIELSTHSTDGFNISQNS